MYSDMDFSLEAKKETFKIRWNIPFDTFNLGYPGGAEGPLPFAWDEEYKKAHGVLFEPSRFYKNSTTLAARLELCNDTNEKIKIRAYIEDLIEYSLSFASDINGSKAVIYNFYFKRTDYELRPGWVSAIGNGFMARGLIRIFESTGEQRHLSLAKQFIDHFFIFSSLSKKTVLPCFTWMDDDGYIWFDEYPGSDGLPSLVLNGHIHALLGIYHLAPHIHEKERSKYIDLLMAGITTIKHKGKNFRRPGAISRYSLREPEKPDYAPDRVVRQFNYLYRMTGDRKFDEYATHFGEDIEKASWEIELIIEGASARAEINDCFKGMEYAFYLLHEGNKVETRWYQKEASATFDELKAGCEYRIIGFRRKGDAPPASKSTRSFFVLTNDS